MFISNKVFFIFFGKYCIVAALNIPQLSNRQCGQPSFEPNFADTFERKVRAVNTSTAAAHSWPWTVLLSQLKKPKFRCGGTLIDVLENGLQSDIVLTAAHCVISRDSIDVTVGAHNIMLHESSAVRVRVHETRLHQDYNETGRKENDIAILKLEKPVKFTKYIKPACLPPESENHPSENSTECYATGWGRTSDSNRSLRAEKLQQIMLPIFTDDQFCRTFSHIGYDRNSTFCAGRFDEKKGLCQGDSGGPLVCKEGTLWYLYGIVMGGKVAYGPNDIPMCALYSQPALFTRVSYYMDWIRQEVKLLSENDDILQKQIMSEEKFIVANVSASTVPLS